MGRRAAVQSSSGGIAVCVLMGTEVPWSAVMQTVGKLSLLCLGVWVCGWGQKQDHMHMQCIYIYVQQKGKEILPLPHLYRALH